MSKALAHRRQVAKRTSEERSQGQQQQEGPTFSGGISWRLRMAIAMHQAGQIVTLDEGLTAEAKALIGDQAPALDPATIVAWLRTLASGVNDAPEDEAIIGRAAALMLACQDTIFDDPTSADPIDGAIFSDDALVMALRRFPRWPAVAELHAFLQDLHRGRRALLISLTGLLAGERPLAIGVDDLEQTGGPS